MVHKLIISQRGKAWKLEIESEVLNGRSIGDKASGKEIKPELEGYEFEITGGSDDAGFPLSAEVAGIGLVSELKTKGFAMKDSTAGIRRRKTVRGKIISDNTAQINLNVIKAGAKKLEEIFPDQNQPKPKEKKKEVKIEGGEVKAEENKAKHTEKPAEAKAEKKAEEKKKEMK